MNPDLPVLQVVLAQAREMLDHMEDVAAVCAPFIGENGSWHVYDAQSESHVDSGVSTHGQRPVRNLLDNSNFADPVNQRAQTSYATAGYTIDRWKGITGNEKVTVQNGSIGLAAAGEEAWAELAQLIDNSAGLLTGRKMTFAADINGTVIVLPLTFGTDAEIVSGGCTLAHSSGNAFAIRVCGTAVQTVYWAALYEGEYTVQNLPPYAAKGYAAELAECQRYLHVMEGDLTANIAVAFCVNANAAELIFHGIPRMRSTPSVEMRDIWLKGNDQWIQCTQIQSFTYVHGALALTMAAEGAVKGAVYVAYFGSAHSHIVLNAEL